MAWGKRGGGEREIGTLHPLGTKTSTTPKKQTKPNKRKNKREGDKVEGC